MNMRAKFLLGAFFFLRGLSRNKKIFLKKGREVLKKLDMRK